MNVVFVVPPENPDNYIESNISSRIERGREFRQKLGLLCVAAYLEHANGIRPEIVDCLADQLDGDGLVSRLSDHEPTIVGLSVLTFNLLDCIDAAVAIKSRFPEVVICFGGFHPTIYPSETLRIPIVDFIVHGEGEEAFSELVATLGRLPRAGKERDAALEKVEGIGWKDSVFRFPRLNSARKAPKFDQLPMPAHHLIDLEKYSVVLADSRSASIQTSRGCPSKCTFCDIRLTKYRYRSAASVLAEMTYLKGRGVEEIFIVDDTFTINRKRVLELCREIVASRLKIRFKISSRIDRVDGEMLEALKEAGCYRIHYGIESGSQRLLDYLEKGITVQQIRDVVRMTKEKGIEVFAYMMIGIPTETREEWMQSISLIRDLKPTLVQYSVCTPFPKTELYRRWLVGRDPSDDYWQAFAERPAKNFRIRTLNEHFSSDELRVMQDKAIRDFYIQPHVIARQLCSIGNPKIFLQKCKLALKLLLPRSLWLRVEHRVH